MPSFVVDPILCTVPDTAEPTETKEWLSALDAWLDAMEESRFDWRHFYPATRALIDARRFPEFESLKRANTLSRLDINLGGLLRRLTRFFQEERHDLREVTATQCVVVADGDVTISPSSFVDRNLPEVRPPLIDGLLCLAADKAAGEEIASDAHLATLPLPEETEDVRIQAKIGLLDPEEMSRRLGDATLDERFPFLLTPADLTRFHGTIYEEIHDGQDLWNRREDLFPNLDLCKEVEHQLREILKGDAALRPIIGRLRSLQGFFESWDGRPIDPRSPLLGSKCSPESQATLDKYGDEHTFTPPHGNSRVFSLHLRFTPGAGRIFFDGDADRKRGLIGYVGKTKLPNVSN